MDALLALYSLYECPYRRTCLCARATRGQFTEHGVCELAPELPADRVRPTGHGSVGKSKSLLAAIVECSAYIEGVTPDGLKDLHGKGLEALSQGHALTLSPIATFFPIQTGKGARYGQPINHLSQDF